MLGQEAHLRWLSEVAKGEVAGGGPEKENGTEPKGTGATVPGEIRTDFHDRGSSSPRKSVVTSAKRGRLAVAGGGSLGRQIPYNYLLGKWEQST